ncbi:agamous-like MADS-box protein AGL82 [Rosa chinensis]|uniref:agamous-like MADS-box protein AGL82 n=1 Tax=Rosa chinensis TaxID=74649 RepID=UPI000D08A68F|nr:agamous-like MADS-box protein AGL82 [Rosa chinensis]
MDPQRNIQELSSSKSDRKKVRDRKKNLIKKAEELSKLCGVDVCLILYQRQSTIAETWPQDPAQVKRIITGYKANPAIRDASIPSSETKGLEETKPRKSDGGRENVLNNSDEEREMLYPTWDDRLDYCSEDELFRLVASLDAKLEASTKRIDSLSMKSCSGFVTPKNKRSKAGALDHHDKVNSNLNLVPFREINDLDDPRSSRNYSGIPTMQFMRSSYMQ